MSNMYTYVVTVGEMTTIRQAKTHETILWLNESREGGEVGS
jgi:hypothetical protein